MSPAVNDTTQASDGQKTTDTESADKTTTKDQTLSSPKSSGDETFTSPKLPPLIPDAEKEET